MILSPRWMYDRDNSHGNHHAWLQINLAIIAAISEIVLWTSFIFSGGTFWFPIRFGLLHFRILWIILRSSGHFINHKDVYAASSGGFLQTLSRVNGLQVLFGDFGGGLDLIGDKKEVKSPQKCPQNFLDLLPWMLFYHSKALHFSSSLCSAYRSQGNTYASYFSSFYFHFYFHTIYFQDFIKRSMNATRTWVSLNCDNNFVSTMRRREPVY